MWQLLIKQLPPTPRFRYLVYLTRVEVIPVERNAKFALKRCQMFSYKHTNVRE